MAACGALEYRRHWGDVSARQVEISSHHDERGDWQIKVAEGPIRQIEIWEELRLGGTAEGDYSEARRGIRYIIPDPRTGPGLLKFGGAIKSIRIRRPRLIGPVAEVRWEHSSAMPTWQPEFWTELTDLLNQDTSVKRGIAVAKRDLLVYADRGRGGCWVLTDGVWDDGLGFLS